MSEGLLESLWRQGDAINAALEAASAEGRNASAEAYEQGMEAEGIAKEQREHIHDAVTQRTARAKR